MSRVAPTGVPFRSDRQGKIVQATLPALVTDRLILRLAEPEEAPLVLAYYRDNRDHLAPFQFNHPEEFFTLDYWTAQLAANLLAFQEDRSVNLFLFLRGTTRPTIVGSVNFSLIVRRASHFCYLGYSIAENEEGKGLMTEALKAAVSYAFDELNLHRIMANYMPSNHRSARVLRGLGFTIEGFARDYLFLNGQWQDHVMTSLTNPSWRSSR